MRHAPTKYSTSISHTKEIGLSRLISYLFKKKIRPAFKRTTLLLLATLITAATLFGPISSSYAQGTPSTQEDCIKSGGTWGYQGSTLGCSGAKYALSLSPIEQAQAFAYYKALRACMTLGAVGGKGGFYKNWGFVGTTAKGEISQQNAIDFEWFNGKAAVHVNAPIATQTLTNGVNIGAFNDPRGTDGDGSQNCGDSEGRAWISKALALWGYDSGPEFLCAIGFTRENTNGIPCTDTTADASNDFKAPDYAWDKLDTLWKTTLGFDSVGIGSIESSNKDHPKAGSYRLYLDNFLSQCRPSEGGTTYSIRVKNDDPNAEELMKTVKYGAPDRDRGTGHVVTLYDQTAKTCQELANFLDKDGDSAVKAYIAWLKANPDAFDETDGGTTCQRNGTCETSGSSCPIEGIGWMVCPLLNALGGVSDAMLGWISSILTLKPLSVTTQAGDDSAQYTAWNSIRNIANVVLVIGFIIIIFSQLTGIGVSNYGVKKTLPRLIIVAILINLSFYVMALAIDLTNIIGTGIGSLFSAITPDMAAAGFSVENIVGSFLTGSTLVLAGATISAGVIASGAIPLSALALMAFPIVATAALGLFAAFATLFIRNALIVVLVVISPLAIAAYLLPNTQNLFTRWRKLFVSMLVLFPMAALLFAGAKFAAYVSVASEQPLSALVALFIMAAPLGMLPFLIRSSNSLLSNIGGKLGNLARSARNPLNKSVSGMVDRQRAGYKAGERGFFGRRQKAGRTNFAQRMNNRRMTREQETKNLQGEATENWREAGLTGNGRSAQKAARALDNEKTLSTRKGALDNEYTARSDARRNTAGTQDHLYNARAENAALESETHRAELEQARTRRIATAPNLSNLDTRLRAAKVETARNEAGLKAQFDQHVQGSQALTDAVQATKAAEETSKTIQMEQDTTFQGALQSDPTLLDLRNRQAAAKLETEALQAEGAAATAKIAATDGTLRGFEERKADANLESAAVAASSEAETTIRQNADEDLKNIKLDTEASKKQKSLADAQFGQVVAEASTDAGREGLVAAGYDAATLDSLRETQLESSVAASATDSAQRIQQKEYAEELKGSLPLAEQAGGIDPYGASRVTAAAHSLLTDTVVKAIASEKTTMSSTPVNGGTPDKPDLSTILRGGDVPAGGKRSPERMSAAASQILKVGADKDIYDVLDYAASLPEGDERTYIQQQIASDIGSRKPTSLGAADIAALARGEYSGGFDEKVVKRITGGKVSADTLTTTSADELTRMIAAIDRGAQGQPNGINPSDPNLAALRTQIDTFFKNENSKLPPPEIVELMKTIQGPPTP